MWNYIEPTVPIVNLDGTLEEYIAFLDEWESNLLDHIELFESPLDIMTRLTKHPSAQAPTGQ
jgi:hypothetical protein